MEPVTLRSANAELSRRPDDEHHNLDSFRAAALADQRSGREVAIRARALLFSESPLPSALGNIDLHLEADRLPATFSHYALSQCCALAGTSPSFLARIKPQTRARVLNEAINRDDVSDRVALVNRDTNTIRAMTSASYKRLWDAEILDNVERWLLPQGWIPAVPTFRHANAKNDKPALFRGDRDSFQFYYSPTSDRPDLGGLRRGIVVYNSEVGARSFGFDTFLFRDMCGNFLIWGAEQVQRKRARHVGRVSSLFSEFRMMLRDYSTELDSETGKRIAVAAETMFASSNANATATDNAAARLVRQYKTTQAQAAKVAEAATLAINQHDGSGQPSTVGIVNELDYFAIANGASWLAHDESNADEKMFYASLGGKVLASAGA